MRVRPGDRDPRGERGATAVVVALVLIAIIGMLSLTVDGGFLFVKFRAMRTANDAAALAAALSCAKNEGLPAADAQADLLAADNVSDATRLADPVYTPGCTPEGGTVTVKYRGSQQLFFSQVVGVTSPKQVAAAATAKWGGAGAANMVSPLMLSMDRLSDCHVPDGPGLVVGETVCVFWWDNSPDYLGNAAWGLMNLDLWGVPATYQCSNAGQQSYGDWLLYGFQGALALNNPPPTYVCRDSGFFGGALDNQIEEAIAAGHPYAFPVNNQNLQIDRYGEPCPPPCTPDKYYIIGFAWLRLIALYRRQDADYNTYCGTFPSTANSRCLVARWEGFSTTGLAAGDGQNYGLVAVNLVG